MTAQNAATFRLTVIIPAHNAELTIVKTLQSILAQNVDGVEVLVIDDGSRVPVEGVLRPLLLNSNLRVVRQDGAGASVARNRGVAEAGAGRLMFVDADDDLVAGSLAPFLDAAEKSEADVVVSDFLLQMDGQSQFVRGVNSDRIDFRAADRTTMQWLTLARVGFGGKSNVGLLGAPWAKIYDRAFLLRSFGGASVFTPGVLRGQDVLFNTEVFGLASHVHYWPKPSYVYYVSGSSASHRATGDFVDRVRHLTSKVIDVLERHGWETLRPAVAKMTVTLLEEALKRESTSLKIADVKALLRQQLFRDAIRCARLRDFGTAGKLKLLAFRCGAMTTLALTSILSRVRRR